MKVGTTEKTDLACDNCFNFWRDKTDTYMRNYTIKVIASEIIRQHVSIKHNIVPKILLSYKCFAYQ